MWPIPTIGARDLKIEEPSMSHKSITAAICTLMALMSLSSTGCFWFATQGPYLGVVSIPIPVSPYLQDKQEDEFWEHERYERVPILGPLTAGGPMKALDPPSDDEVMRALEHARPIEGGLPLLHETHRDNVQIVKEKIADYIDPPRFVPLIGPCQLHHAHYKCTIYFTEVTHVGWPVPYTMRDEDSVEVVYIDHNHFHMVGHIDPGVHSNY
jgi:hypothetical protein